MFLSCCESNLGLPATRQDDILTIATGFLIAGARRVISSLWSVEEVATTLLSILYYQERAKGESPVIALQKAQQELRAMTRQQFEGQYLQPMQAYIRGQITAVEAELPKHQGEAETSQRLKEQIGGLKRYLRYLGEFAKQDQPFAHPYYWAGFTCQGLS